MTRELTPGETASQFNELADEVDDDPNTTYTDDTVYAATQRLRDALTRKLVGADVIRNRPIRNILERRRRLPRVGRRQQ